MKRVTIYRNGQLAARDREVSDLKIGSFEPGERVMLGIKGDCCSREAAHHEYRVSGIERVDRFGGRDRVTFERIRK